MSMSYADGADPDLRNWMPLFESTASTPRRPTTTTYERSYLVRGDDSAWSAAARRRQAPNRSSVYFDKGLFMVIGTGDEGRRRRRRDRHRGRADRDHQRLRTETETEDAPVSRSPNPNATYPARGIGVRREPGLSGDRPDDLHLLPHPAARLRTRYPAPVEFYKTSTRKIWTRLCRFRQRHARSFSTSRTCSAEAARPGRAEAQPAGLGELIMCRRVRQGVRSRRLAGSSRTCCCCARRPGRGAGNHEIVGHRRTSPM